MPSSSAIRAALCLWGGCIRLLTSALTASLYRRIGHVLKPPDGWIKGVTTFLKPGVRAIYTPKIGASMAAKSMGHSLQVHNSTYQRWFDASGMEALQAELLNPVA